MAHDIPEGFIERLREDLAERRIESGTRWLKKHAALFTSLEPSSKNAAALVGYLAQWVDVSFADPGLVKKLLVRFPSPRRGALPLGDYVHLRLAEGMVAMAEEEPDEAIRHFDFVISLAADLKDREAQAIAHFWKARCLRKKGEYDSALTHTLAGKELALELGRPKTAAVMAVLESWLFFQKGKSKEAFRILEQAEAALRETDDYVALGNIQSAYGRMVRREGRYDQALDHFARAIEAYKKRDPQHRNLARSLSNMAHVKRLVSLQLVRKIDADAARRHKRLQVTGRRLQGPADQSAAGRKQPGNGSARSAYRQRFEQLRKEAFAELEEAAGIYARHPNHRGAGSVHVNRGLLHLDNGEFDRADAEAARAYELGEEKKDYILMARARLLRCMAANGRLEEEIEEGLEPGHHAQLAQEAAREAVELAKHTQNRRLLARAHIWQAVTLCNEFFDDPDAARQSCDLAAEYLKAGSHDDLMQDLHALKTRILRAGTVDSTLRSWSQGLVGARSFQQMTEEFAELVIPKVWAREGRKVSRVAARLSVSPKKVRRILRRMGLHASKQV